MEIVFIVKSVSNYFWKTEEVIITKPSLANAAQYLVMTNPLSLPQYFSIPFFFLWVFKHLEEYRKQNQ